ncbi:TPA: hypothetical protein U1W61_000160 [Streptococcus suis]|nr:hypothetical protein [Streptococcus suis]
MTDQRDLIFQTNSHGTRSLKKNKVSDEEIEKIISYCLQNQVGKLKKLQIPNLLKYGLDTTLYIVKVDRVARAIVSIDEDDLFNQIIITLYSFSRDHDLDKMVRKTTESFLQEIKPYLDNEVDRYAD